jgi:glycosyltransferase involved in cell wall biosynthesis
MRNYGATEGLYRGMKIRTIPSLSMRSFEKLSAAFMATLYQCFEPGVDVVHFHAFGPGMFSFLPRLFGRKVVVQGHGLEWKRSRWSFWGRLFLKLTEAPSVLLPHCLTVVSRVQQEYILEKYGRESIYIPTGVNPIIASPPEIISEKYGLQGNDYILFASRLVREKGVHYLLEAYRRLETDLKLVIAGDARYEEEYKAELQRLAADDPRIIFTGFVTGKLLEELMDNCYLFVLPSEIEGLPTVLLEAMSYGTCCLVSDIPENSEALNGLGYTFRSGDVTDLQEKLKLLISVKDDVDKFKAPAKEYVVRNFTWDAIADSLEKLYQGMNKSSEVNE